MKGYVYIISNKGMPNLIKVGFSTKDPHERAKKLGGTGAAHPYEVEYEVLVSDPRSIEQTVHRKMNDYHEGKEWFRCTVEYAIIQVQTVVGDNKLYEHIVNPIIKPLVSVEVVSAETLVSSGVVAYDAGDYAVALDNFQKAADQGFAEAQYNLGWMYANGQGVLENERIAVDWYQKAAEQGYARAQNNLGMAYAFGDGVLENIETAYFWWLIASANGDEDAKTLIEIAEKELSPAKKQAVQNDVVKWKPKR